MARVTVELYGVPRLRAGMGSVALEAANVGEAVVALGRRCPALEGTTVYEGIVQPAYRLGLNGDLAPILSDRPLKDGDVLLLLAADAGG